MTLSVQCRDKGGGRSAGEGVQGIGLVPGVRSSPVPGHVDHIKRRKNGKYLPQTFRNTETQNALGWKERLKITESRNGLHRPAQACQGPSG